MTTMKFAFSTESCPAWDFPTIAGEARQYGYDGVEISGAGSTGAPGQLTLHDAARNSQVLGTFTAANIEIACVAAPVRLAGERRADAKNAEALLRWIDLSAELTCPRLMIRDPEPRRGVSGGAAGMALGEWLAPIADHALDRGITILVSNDATLTSARLMWTMLERLRHPAVACCWDLHLGVRARSTDSADSADSASSPPASSLRVSSVQAGQAGESPALSVPTLNSQIRYARVSTVPATAGSTREPGNGCDVQLFLTRLRGIGYDGYVTAAPRPAPIAAPDEYLKDMAASMKKWGAPAIVSGRRKQETRPKAG
jgi:sugar phosphate isomerase/epimerase